MPEKTPLPNLADYETIEAAVMETARGRWFLAEHARRARAVETGLVLSAIARLEAAIAADRSSAREAADLQASLAEMAGTFTRMAAELTAIIMEARAEAYAPPDTTLHPEPVEFATDGRTRAPQESVAAPVRALQSVPPEVAQTEETVPPSVEDLGSSPGRRSVMERMSALADLDLLDTREKLRRFT